ncbi:YgaP family membrane protein [Puniceibacterium sediminis]|uniref:Inner membrane protein YgaP-like transmembrane domain-containing protein n=1 Tax=Puniceibacterium sediminis TaxID=1608407 RepID=A0A238ZS88_9RHOB|nr:DUF2892 domain-containing protein [Puniceibacterium sediminis]SNR86012.1 Protein of unknown function [Puniceibacterium sediminis]
MFAKNVGTIDRVVRVILGLALLAGYFMTNGPYTWVYLIGIIPLATGLMGTCPVYSLFGVNTCPMKK